MSTRDDLGPTFLPTFTPLPSPKTLDDGSPTEPVDPRLLTAERRMLAKMDQAPAGPSSQKPAEPAGEDTRTPTSSGGSNRVGDPKQAAKLVAGLLGLGFVLAAGLLRQIGKADVRRPTKAQSAGFAEPVARILARRTDLSAVGPDLADVIEAGAAVGDYLTDGPIVVGRAAPEYLDEDQGDEPEPSEPILSSPPEWLGGVSSKGHDGPTVTYMP